MKSILLAATFAAILPAYATADNRELTYEEVAREALSHGPESARIGATLAERAAEAFSVKVKENPSLNLDVEAPIDRPTSSREDTGVSLAISQAIRPSDFGQRGEVAQLIQETGDSEQVLALNELLASLTISYARTWQFQEMELLLKDARARVSKILKRVTAQGTQGAFGEGDIELLRAELESFEADGVAARGDFNRSLAELIRTTGAPFVNRVLRRPAAAPVISREALERLVRESRLPVQKRFQLLKELSRKRLEVSRLDSFPAISPRLGYSHHDDGTDQVVAGFSIPLPVFNRNQAEKLRAEGDLAIAEQGERYATSDAIVTEALALYDAADDTRRQVEIFDTKVVPSRRRSVEAYYRQFEAGAASAFQLWQAQRELNDSRRRSLELTVTLADAQAKLSTLIGQPQF